jgi:hypothetical protein
MFFRNHFKKINNVSVIILTQHSEEYLAILLIFLTKFFSEIIVGVDKKSTEDTFRIAGKYTTKAFWVENPAGIVENAIEQLASHSSNDWILRLDDDELISTQLIDFIVKYLQSLSVDAIGIHRKWCRVNLTSSSLEYSINPIYGFDWQWRLFRKSKVAFNPNIHTPGIRFRTETKTPLDAFIMHLDWVYRDYQYRQEKVARYESICKGTGHSEFYLYEQDPASEAFFTPLYLSDFEDVTRRLIPFQQKTNLLTTSFFTPDLNNLNVSLVSKISMLSVTPAEQLRIPIILINCSENAYSSSHPYMVNLSYHWKRAGNGDYIVFEGVRTKLLHPIHPGESMEQFVDVIAPDKPGSYNLEISLVKENAYWFEHKNPKIPLIIPGEVAFPITVENEILGNLNLLSFDVGLKCQLWKLHKECPINAEERHPNKSFGHLTPALVAQVIDQAQELGFKGWVTFHYYNEPLLYMDEISEIMRLSSYDKFLLWTNGLLLAEHQSSLERFHTIHITDYQLPNSPDFQKIMAEHPGINWVIRKISLDARFSSTEKTQAEVYCTRPEYLELPIDYYGNIHLCCYDWKGATQIGNILERKFSDSIQSNTFKALLAGLKSGAKVPNVCKSCRFQTRALKVF